MVCQMDPTADDITTYKDVSWISAAGSNCDDDPMAIEMPLQSTEQPMTEGHSLNFDQILNSGTDHGNFLRPLARDTMAPDTTSGSEDSMPLVVSDGNDEPSGLSESREETHVTFSTGPSEVDWERYKPKIKKLYARHTLDEVMKAMKGEHGLRASEKMYKDRIRKWKIDKRIKGNEMQAIIRKQTQRARVGKRSTFSIRDSQVPESKIARYRRAKRLISAEEILAIRAATPPGLTCYTPLASPLTTPRELETPELIMKLIQEYISGSLESKTWIMTEDQRCISVKGPHSFMYTLEGRFRYAKSEFLNNHSDNGWRSLNMAMALVEQVILAEDPHSLYAFIELILDTSLVNGLKHISLLLLNQVSAMSTKIMALRHPFRQMFPLLLAMGPFSLKHTLLLAQGSIADCFAREIGRFSRTALLAKLDTIALGGIESTAQLVALLEECENALGISDERCLYNRLHLARHYLLKKKPREAIETAKYVVAVILESGHTYYLSVAYEIRAQAHFLLSERGPAEHSIRRAILIRADQFGWEDVTLLRFISIHDRFLRALNRLDEAAEVCRFRDGILDSKFKKLQMEEDERYRKTVLEA